jgi:predicted ribosomally synthesized peptide with SipW-like signal peptide
VKKIVIASAAMGGAALIAFGASGTFAAFTDQQQITASAGTGSIVLDMTKATDSASASVSNLKPGDTKPTQYAYWVQNGGTLDGTLTAAVTMVDNENNCVGPEADNKPGTATKLDATCTGANAGEFSYFAQVQGFVTGAQNAGQCKATTAARTPLAAAMTLNEAAKAAKWLSQTVPATAGACIVIDLTLPDNPNINLAQGDSADLTATFTLEQVTGTQSTIRGGTIERPGTHAQL